MPLSEKQQQFLEKYVSKWGKRISKSKVERAGSFQEAREEFFRALEQLPEGMRQEYIEKIASAEKLGEKLKFNRATQAINLVTAEVTLAKFRLQMTDRVYLTSMQPFKKGSQVDGKLLLQLKSQYENAIGDHGTGFSWNDLAESKEHGQECTTLRSQLDQLMQNNGPTIENIDRVKSLIWKISNKRRLLEKRAKEIEKLKHRLARDSKSLMTESTNPDESLKRAMQLSEIPKEEWTQEMFEEGMALYPKLTLQIALRDGIQGKDLKEGEEIVFAARRKYASKEQQSDELPNETGLVDPNTPNFKMVIKPISKEMGVTGFEAGGGGGREVFASIMSNKLGDMLGIDFGVPTTILTKVDGGRIGMTSGQDEIASVQLFAKNSKGLDDTAKKDLIEPDQKTNKFAQGVINERVPKESVHTMALFDFIALHMDRHGGNMLIGEDNELIPIDHGNILPTRRGLRKRRENIDNVISSVDASDEMFGEEFLHMIDELDPEALSSTLIESIKQLPKEANKGLEEGIRMSKRSTEFLKFAARHLKINQIYEVLGTYMHLIFDSSESKKLEAFQTAIDAHLSLKIDADYLKNNLGLKKYSPEAVWEKMKPTLISLGWITESANNSIKDRKLFVAATHSLRLIHERNLQAPKLTATDVPKIPDSLAEQATLWNRFFELGGTEACIRLGIDAPNHPKKLPMLIERIDILQHAMIAGLGSF
jgi:Phosphatidylinositol 3- and 4-kinase